jgi:DNA-binding NarL/FixJ family response regulator
VRVLVVDDSTPVRKRLVEMLRDARALDRDARALDVDEARDTEEAERLLETRQIDVLVLDMHIGKNSALDFIGTVKKKMPEVAVIVLTNDASAAHRRECLLRGADHFFDKSRQFERAVEVAVAYAPSAAAAEPRLFSSPTESPAQPVEPAPGTKRPTSKRRLG